MRVLVTGASGYIGSLLIEKLQQNPFIEKIIAVDVKKNIKDNEKVEFFYKDIRDPEICTLIRIYQNQCGDSFSIDCKSSKGDVERRAVFYRCKRNRKYLGMRREKYGSEVYHYFEWGSLWILSR